jgi:uncharacterized protein YneF (UPF0154 family)
MKTKAFFEKVIPIIVYGIVVFLVGIMLGYWIGIQK